MSETLTREEQQILLDLARQQVIAWVGENRKIRPTDSASMSPLLKVPGACFVTLRNAEQLRGCIGTMMAVEPLYQAVLNNAVNACEDPRFRTRPITPDEVGTLHIEISYLTPLQPVDSHEEIEVGRHGVMLTVGYNRGVFLPQVPVEMNWDKQTYLEQLGLKAGLDSNAYLNADASLEVFEAQVFGERDFVA